ncbi:2-dehydropantoate 2-reductase [Salirhabdus euzebyi]|uniref:2-dehydropantoate 2-reductase n=1 Tax=Salirhabdus euzebyi TaxID=394506 RepID=A0A841PY34_9BACI|nr:ketopantoate reductase family protein [Salirhabdus euzebyi]MBB6451761.1 2-dehydropantoate 2-reductase [Salirhabdus euzebyi]
MNIVVFGAGAVGGYFGGKLALKGYPVNFLVREKRYEQLKARGLKVESFYGDFTIEPRVVLHTEEIESPDLVIVALKNYHVDQAMPQLEELVNKGAKLLPLLNGMEHLDLFVSKFGKENVLGGICYVASTLNEHGDVVQTSQMQDIYFGPLSNAVDQTFLAEIKAIMKESSIHVTLTDSIIAEMWKKYIFLTSLSGITTATRQPIGIAIQDEVTYSFLYDLLTEIYEVAKAKDVPLAVNTVDTIASKLQNLPTDMTSSMHRDLQKGLRMELDSLHGYLLKEAQKHQLNTPCLRAIYALLHPYKNGNI